MLQIDGLTRDGKNDSANYKGLHQSDHAETVKIVYDSSVVSLQELLAHYFRIIDATVTEVSGLQVFVDLRFDPWDPAMMEDGMDFDWGLY